MIDYSFIEDLKKIPTGIKGFEHLSNGGLTQNRTTLVCGTSGAGKTLFVIEILYRGITQYNRPGIFVTFEERPKAIVQNVKSLNWGLVKLIKEKKLMFVDASPEPDPVLEIGEYDLSGLLIQIKEAIKEINAEIVVMDSIGALFGQFTNTQLIRTEMLRITEELKKCGVTTVITAERLEEYGTISRHGIEEFLSDNVIVLRNVLEEEKCRRTIQILKVRGDTHIQGEFPFIISSTGFNIMSLTAIELIQTSSLKKVSTGNKKLDEITNGGIFQDSVFLVSGPTGGGKTLMSTIFASAACKNNEKTLLLAYEESREQLLRNAISWGINFEEWEKKNLLKICCQYPEKMGLEEHLLVIQKEVAAFKPKRLIMDSISAMERVSTTRNFREFVIGLTSFVKQESICSLFTSTTPQLHGGESVTEAHISTITDIIMLLRYVEINGYLRRGISVIKMRGSQHEKQVFEFTIDAKGLHIGDPFKNVQNIILGFPTSLGPTESEHLGGMFKD